MTDRTVASARRGGDREADRAKRGSGGSGDGPDDGGDAERRNDRKRTASTAEKAVITISVTFTLLLFAYAGWQMAVPQQADDPQVSVVGTEPMPDGSVAVRVRLRNPTDVGFVSVTVQSSCSSPPPAVQFSYVPALSSRTGTLVCPPGTTNPAVSIANWVSQ